MLKDEDLARVASIFNALGSPVRLRILSMLIDTKKPLHIKGVARSLKMDYAAVYRHVSVLKEANLIEVYEVGRSRVLSPVKGDLILELIRRVQELSS